jgi:hypothetical protein
LIVTVTRRYWPGSKATPEDPETTRVWGNGGKSSLVEYPIQAMEKALISGESNQIMWLFRQLMSLKHSHEKASMMDEFGGVNN